MKAFAGQAIGREMFGLDPNLADAHASMIRQRRFASILFALTFDFTDSLDRARFQFSSGFFDEGEGDDGGGRVAFFNERCNPIDERVAPPYIKYHS